MLALRTTRGSLGHYCQLSQRQINGKTVKYIENEFHRQGSQIREWGTHNRNRQEGHRPGHNLSYLVLKRLDSELTAQLSELEFSNCTEKPKTT